jgi:hypothetical protein
MKRRTTARGAPRDKKTVTVFWLQAWKDLPQEKIQQWIERIPRQIQEIIRLEGGNEYKEERTGKESRSWKGQRIKGKLSTRQDLDEDEKE